MRGLPLALAILISFTIGTGNALAGGKIASGENMNKAGSETQRRADLTYKIVRKWAPHVQETYSLPAKKWAQEMLPLFRQSPMTSMQLAADAPTFDKMNSILLQSDKAPGSKSASTKLIGEIANDLVFVPITPCRIFDTRLAGGQIPANTVRSFDITSVTDYSFQGGDASNCNGAGAAGSFAAAAINFTVVNPVVPGSGFLTAFPFLAAQPNTATMVFRDGQLISNLAIVRLDQGPSANELSVYSSHLTHVVGDLVGYYVNPQATALECVEVASAGATIAGGDATTQQTPACPVGYSITGGSCGSTTFESRVVTSRTFLNTRLHFCAFRNEGVASVTVTAYGVCCRTPGRP